MFTCINFITVIDICCGTGAFLITALNRIKSNIYLESISDEKKKSRYGLAQKNSLIGVERDASMYAENIHEARELLENECVEKVNAIIFLSYKPVGNVKRKVLEKGAELDKFIEELLRYDRCQIGFVSCMISPLVDKSELINLCSIDYCEAGRFSAFISEEGNMYPCSFMCGARLRAIIS